MKQTPLPSYEELDKALSETALKLHPSQVHGLISGVLCGDFNKKIAWEKLVTGAEDPKVTHEVLQKLYSASEQELKDFLFEFQLILPSDEEKLPERAEALTLWCQGFLTGLKFAKIEIADRKPSDMAEVINDLVEIAKMNYEEVIANEEDEEAYIELVEYVRMGVIMIYQDIRAEAKSTKTSNSSSHLH